MATKRTGFTWTNYLVRLAAALALVFATYNPTGWSYFHWATDALRDLSNVSPLAALGAILLIVGWAIFLRATMRSLGPFGLLLAIAFFAILIWMLISWFPALTGNSAIVYLLLIGLSGVLSIGISWSHIRRRMTGQLDVDDPDT
jgi:hypothetical protein